MSGTDTATTESTASTATAGTAASTLDDGGAPAAAAPAAEPGDSGPGEPPDAAPAAESPLESDRQAYDNSAVYHIYWTDQRSGGVYVTDGGSVTAEDLAGRDATAKDVRGGRRTRLVGVSATSPGELRRLREVTVPVESRVRAIAVLERERVVVLSGPPGTGKRAAAMALLEPHERILDVDPSVSAKDLAEFDARILRKDETCYVVESMLPDTARALNAFTLRALSRKLAKAGAYLVVTVDERVPLQQDLTTWTVPWRARPPLREVLARHIRYYLSATDPAADAGPPPDTEADTDGDRPARAAAERAILERLDTLDAVALLADRELRLADRLAQHAVRTHRAGGRYEDCVTELGLDARRRVEEWFTKNHDLDEIALLLAVAVLGGCTYATIAAQAARLEQLLADVSRVDLTEQPRSHARSRANRLRAVMATLDRGILSTEFGTCLAETVALESTGLVTAVLDVVWHEYDVLAEALVRWLHELGNHTDSAVRIRVGCAAGQLAEYDFAAIRSQLLLPWAKSDLRNPGLAATYALGVPAGRSETAGMALGLLHHWATLYHHNLAWTAASAYGGYVGLLHPHVAMAELMGIALRSPDSRLDVAVAVNVQSLFALGCQQDPAVAVLTLASLTDWFEPGLEPCPAIARRVFTGILRRVVQPGSWLARTMWQRLTSDEGLPAAADLLGRCLDDADTRAGTLEVLRELLDLASDDPELYLPLERLVLRCAALPGRGAQGRRRLEHYVERWSRGPDAPTSARNLARAFEREFTT